MAEIDHHATNSHWGSESLRFCSTGGAAYFTVLARAELRRATKGTQIRSRNMFLRENIDALAKVAVCMRSRIQANIGSAEKS